jgi:hypothetical protein
VLALGSDRNAFVSPTRPSPTTAQVCAALAGAATVAAALYVARFGAAQEAPARQRRGDADQAALIQALEAEARRETAAKHWGLDAAGGSSGTTAGRDSSGRA